MPLLANHIAVVTGAGSGIGRAIAAGYAREGARVVVLDINKDAAAETAQQILNAGGKAESKQGLQHGLHGLLPLMAARSSKNGPGVDGITAPNMPLVT